MNAVLPETGLSAWLEGTYEVAVDVNVPKNIEHTPIKVKIEVIKNT